MTARPPLPPLHPPADLFSPSGRPSPGRERGAAAHQAPPAAEPALNPGSAATPIHSSGRPDHPRVSPSLGAPAKGTAGGSRRGAEVVTPAAPAATADPRDLGRLKGPLYILARDAPVTWDAATRRWWGCRSAGFCDAFAGELVARGLARRDGNRLVLTHGESHAA